MRGGDGPASGMIAVRCSHDLDDVMRRAGGRWEPGTRQWLIERRSTDPLFRQARHRPGRGLTCKPGRRNRLTLYSVMYKL
jgi:hypothetical protein